MANTIVTPIEGIKSDWSQFYIRTDDALPETEFIGGLFPRELMTIVASRAGVGKTWYMLKLIADLTRGGDIFMTQKFNEPPRRVLYFCGETNAKLINERIRQMYDQPDHDRVRIVSYMDMATRRIFLDLDTKEGAEIVHGMIQGFAPDLVIFDTMMSFRRDDENSAQSTRDMCSRLQFLAGSCHCAVIAAHHLRKKQQGHKDNIDQDEIIGSSALVRMAGVALILSKVNGIVRSDCVKSWWKEPPHFIYEMSDKSGKITFEIADPFNDETEKRLRVQKYIERMFEQGAGVNVQAMMEKFKCNDRTVRNALKRFETTEQHVGTDVWYTHAKSGVVGNNTQVEIPINEKEGQDYEEYSNNE